MSETSTQSIVVGRMQGRVKWVSFNRPEVRNAITLESADLARAQLQAAVAEGARVVVLTGSGGSFCAGADLKAIAMAQGQFSSVREVLLKHYHPLVKAIVELPMPVVAAVDGPAAGIGSDIALACDLRLASESAYFSEIFVNISLIPDGGGTYHLPRLVGMARAMEMAFTGRRVTAAEALDWGMINAVYPGGEFEARVQEFADLLAEKAPLSVRRSKLAIRAALNDQSVEAALEREADLQEELFASEDFREGVGAFLEKRPARFQGK